MTASPLRIFLRTTLGGAVAGVLLAAPMMAMAWDHNPQGEFHEAGVIHWAWFELGLLWASLAVVPCALLGALLALDARKRHRADSTPD